MNRNFSTLFIIIMMLVSFTGCGILSREEQVVIVYPQNASIQEILAAREIRRYVYQRTGHLLEIIQNGPEVPEKNDLIVVARKNRPIVQTVARNAGLGTLLTIIDSEHYLLKTIQQKKRRVLLITSGDTLGTLYGAYRFAEHLGVRFYLHGDVIPDGRIEFELPNLTEDARPLFAIRGILPFHDFPEGPDWWNVEDYKAILSQLPKLRMNFFGLHTYPESPVGPEPTVWIGLSDDVNENGSVKFSYPSRYFTTLEGGWGYTAKKTSEFAFGAGELFEYDAYGSDIMLDHSPVPAKPEDFNEVFNRTGNLLRESFNYARILGIKTCLGTETPLTIPKLLKERLKEKGKDPDDLSVVQEIYEGIFNRINKTHDLDYYWFWTPERWIWGETAEDGIQATKNDMLAALKAAEKINAPFTLATCGWVLGPQSDRALFDNILPEEMPMSCINLHVGMSPVDPAFGEIKRRPKWAIPWLEDDPALTSPQLWVGRMRSDAADALKYQCTGLIGIHWRTRILGPTVSALARAAWNQHNFKRKPFTAGPVEGQVSDYFSTLLFKSRYTDDIAGTEDDPLYNTFRYDLSAYHLEVPDGIYTVFLKFCEHQHDKKGTRVFSVNIQGKTVLEELDIFAEAGKKTALDYKIENVQVTDGRLIIDFIRKFDYPMIAAIAVQNDDYSQKVNCGGPAYKDYNADREKAQPRDLVTEDFYDDWALNQFGPEAADEISQLFQKIDGQLPRPATWINGPGNLFADSREWREVSKEYAFESTFEKYRSRIKGAGNLERFDYWLNNFSYMRTTAQLNCMWGRFSEAMKKVTAENDPKAKAELAKETALPWYRKMVMLTGEVYRYLLATVTTNGEIGTVTNMDTHNLPLLLEKTGKELSLAMGEDLPEDTIPSRQYTGAPRVIVPTVRSCVTEDEVLNLKVIILDTHPPVKAEIYWRVMGIGEFKSKSLKHVNRGVYTVQLQPDEIKGEDIEYYLKVVTHENKDIYFPATAPEINQTVVVIPGT